MRVRTFDPANALTYRARELAKFATAYKSDATVAARQAEQGRLSDDDRDAQLALTAGKIEGAINDRLQRLITASGEFLAPSEIAGSLKAAGWSKADIGAALYGAGLTYREP